MIDTSKKYFLMIEPDKEGEPSLFPAEDELTEKARKVISLAKPIEEYAYKGFHMTRCGQRSDNKDWKLPNGMITNSLALYYVQHYRSLVPKEEIEKIELLYTELIKKMETTVTAIKPDTTIDVLEKIDIRIGKVLSASLIEKTALIKQEVSFGALGIRQIVSKIAKVYKPEDLIGKSFPYMLNLPPRPMMGVESQGMIIAVTDKITNKVVLLPSTAEEGSIVF